MIFGKRTKKEIEAILNKLNEEIRSGSKIFIHETNCATAPLEIKEVNGDYKDIVIGILNGDIKNKKIAISYPSTRELSLSDINNPPLHTWIEILSLIGLLCVLASVSYYVWSR